MFLWVSESRSEQACAQLLSSPLARNPAPLWDVMASSGGDWVSLPDQDGLVFRRVGGGATAPTELRIAWAQLGGQGTGSDPLLSASGAFIDALGSYLFHRVDSGHSEFYLISLPSGTVQPLHAYLRSGGMAGGGLWDFVGEDHFSGELFFRQRGQCGQCASGAQSLVGLLARGRPQDWHVTPLTLPALSSGEVQSVQSVRGGQWLLVGVRGRGLVLLDQRTQSVLQELTEAQISDFLEARGEPAAERSRFFWDRVHVSENGMRLTWGVSRIAQGKFLPPVVMLWDLSGGPSQKGLSATRLGSTPADVYDWVFAEAPGHPPRVYVFGTGFGRTNGQETSRSVLWKWDFQRRPDAETLSAVQTPYTFSGCEMECRMQREVVRQGWLLTSDQRALSPDGRWIQLPRSGAQVLSWSRFKRGVYTLQQDAALHWVLRWIPVAAGE